MNSITFPNKIDRTKLYLYTDVTRTKLWKIIKGKKF
jgi:hypothetical protein